MNYMSWKDEKRRDEKARAQRQESWDRIHKKDVPSSQPYVQLHTHPVTVWSGTPAQFSWTHEPENTTVIWTMPITASSTSSTSTFWDWANGTTDTPPTPRLCCMCGEALPFGCTRTFHAPSLVRFEDSTKDCTPSCMWCAKMFNNRETLEAHEAVCSG